MLFRKLLKPAALLVLSLFCAAELHAQSALDGFDPNANGSITIVVLQPDGKILIGGHFTTLAPNGGVAATRNHIARLNRDGTLDTAFNPDANYAVYSIVVQTDGKILVGGYFTSIGGQTRHRIARLDPTTGLADSFNPDANDDVYSIAVQPDGKILAGGYFDGIGGQTRSRIARLDPVTGLADSFNPSAAGPVMSSIVVQADGKILVGGYFTSIGGETRHHIARLSPATGLADSFNPNADNSVQSIAVQADGKILAGGNFTSIGGQTRNQIARLDPTTGVADSFDPNPQHPIPGYCDVRSIEVQADGKILAGGNFTSIGGATRHHIARLDPDTGLADSFDPNADRPTLPESAEVGSIAVQADGKILVGGNFNTLAPNGGPTVTRNNIARLETDGRLDQTLDVKIDDAPSLSGYVATAIQPDGKIIIGGQFNKVMGVTRHNIARLNTDGSLDMAFNPDADIGVDVIAIQADGKIVVGGNFTHIGGQQRNRLARLDPTTGLADSFNPNAGAIVSALAIQADGKILAGGSFQNNFNGQLRRFIARFDPTTGLADSFNPSPDNTVFTIAIQRDGKILVGGAFTNILGFQPRNRLARLDPTTGEADSFNPNANDAVQSIVVQKDGNILASGRFTTIGGQPRQFFARLNATTGLADSFNPNPDEGVSTFALQADGKILAVGFFTQIGGQMRNHLARLDGVNGLADSFDVHAAPLAFIYNLGLQTDGKIVAGGSFSGENGGIGGQNRDFLARLTNDTAARQNLAITKTAVTWTRGGSSAEFNRVTFEFSNDNVNYTALGNGTPAGQDWVLSGLNLPFEENFYVRARGYWSNGHSESITESVRNAFIPGNSTLRNISTRLRVQTGDNAMIGGFIITGTQTKTVIVRGIGPSLPIPGALADPVIEVHGSSGELLATNDNWNDAATRQEIIDSGLAPINDLESALFGTINPGAYTVVIRGKDNSTGIGLFEVYDLDQAADSKLGNVSTRGFVGTGDDVLIGGIISVGKGPATVLLRAIGPSLASFGVPNALADPTLALYDGNGQLIAINYDWRDDQEAEISGTGLPPSNDLEAAMVRELSPGNYTAILSGLSNTTGVALIEAYDLD